MRPAATLRPFPPAGIPRDSDEAHAERSQSMRGRAGNRAQSVEADGASGKHLAQRDSEQTGAHVRLALWQIAQQGDDQQDHVFGDGIGITAGGRDVGHADAFVPRGLRSTPSNPAPHCWTNRKWPASIKAASIRDIRGMTTSARFTSAGSAVRGQETISSSSSFNTFSKCFRASGNASPQNRMRMFRYSTERHETLCYGKIGSSR